MTHDGRPSLLIVTMGTDALAPARMPRELQAAGFAVTLLAPRSAIAVHTRFLDGIAYFPEPVTLFEWIRTLAGVARTVRPALLLPGDDVTVSALVRIALDPPAVLAREIDDQLSALIARSLGDPAHFATAVDKSRFIPLARAAGVRVPEGGEVSDDVAAVKVADALGYPVIVRPASGTAAAGVARCESATAVRDAFRALPPVSSWGPPSARAALVQRFVVGRGVNRAALGWNGREVAGFARTALARAHAFGPGSVSRTLVDDAIAAMNARLIEAAGITGYASTQYIVEAATGLPYLIELNRRMTPATYMGARAGVNLAAALAAAVAGRAWEGARDIIPGRELALALFPQEWLRDPASAHLRALPSDTPWDDPQLLRAMFRLAR
jgi:predicted ATP-grasp superfamily ATP-dependent carboligase